MVAAKGLETMNGKTIYKNNMDIQTINDKIIKTFPAISQWIPRQGKWKGRTILTGFKVQIAETDYYVFIGKNGLGHMVKRHQAYVPLYCEIALVKGGIIETSLDMTFTVISKLLPEHKRKKSYYRYASFNVQELESAGQKLIDVLSVIL